MEKIVVNVFSLPVLCLHLPLKKDMNLVSLTLRKEAHECFCIKFD
mgnify:CR=1 FL=1